VWQPRCMRLSSAWWRADIDDRGQRATCGLNRQVDALVGRPNAPPTFERHVALSSAVPLRQTRHQRPGPAP
jgi:hypothetical protein